MEVNISSADNLSSIIDSLKNNDVNNIEIMNLDSSAIPYLDFFIDQCKKLNCNVQIYKQVLVDHDILEHFSDFVQT